MTSLHWVNFAILCLICYDIFRMRTTITKLVDEIDVQREAKKGERLLGRIWRNQYMKEVRSPLED